MPPEPPPDRHEAFTRLFLANQHRVFCFVMTLVHDRAEAEELFQETAVTLWRRWEEFDSTRNFSSWACGIAMNHFRNWLRKNARRGERLPMEMLERLASQRLENADALEVMHRALAVCLDKLPIEQRDMVEKFYGRTISIRDVATAGGQSENVAYKLLAKIRRQLRLCIERSMGLGGTITPEAG